jgi:hypothetical protein
VRQFRHKRQWPKVSTFRDDDRQFVRDEVREFGVAGKERKFGHLEDSPEGYGESSEDLQQIWE